MKELDIDELLRLRERATQGEWKTECQMTATPRCWINVPDNGYKAQQILAKGKDDDR